MRWIFLVVGLAAGFGLGYAVREEAPPRAERRTVAATRATGHGDATAGARASSRSAEPRPAAPQPAIAAEPTEKIPEEEDWGDPAWGRVIVDFRNSDLRPSATITGRDVFGNQDEESQTADESRLIEFSVHAGRLLVWWKGRDGERLGAWVKVAGSRTTHLGVDKGVPLPLPDGLGRLDVFVSALGGGPQSEANVELEGDGDIWSESVSESTTATGRCRFEVMPGTYKLTLGARTIEAVVEAGTTRSVEFRHENEGDLVIRNAPPLTSFEIVRENEDPDADEESVTSESSFIYLRPGRYLLSANVYANGSDLRALGTVQVIAKQLAEVDPRLPTGGLRIEIDAEERREAAEPLLRLKATAEMMAPAELSARADEMGEENGRERWHKEFIALSPGEYVLLVGGKGWRPVKRIVRVDRGVERVDVELERAPK